jgi:hypothetical protein
LSHPLLLSNALPLAAMLHYYLREGKAVQERAEAVIALCTKYGFPRRGGRRQGLRRCARAWPPGRP